MPCWSRFRLLGTAVALLLSGLGVAGCGTAAPPRPGPSVSLKLTSPADGSRTSATSGLISGTVTPHRARVLVLGQRVRVSADGSFSSRVQLSVGANLIDVEASLPRSAGAVGALRVTRFLLVAVPQVVGDGPSQATTTLKARGFEVRTHGSSDPLSFLIPGSSTVCSSSPAAGTKVDPGSVVTITTSKVCL